MMSLTRISNASNALKKISLNQFLKKANIRQLSVLHLQTTPSNFAYDLAGKFESIYKTHLTRYKIQVINTETNFSVDVTKIHALEDKDLVELVQSLLKSFRPVPMMHVLAQLDGKGEFSPNISSQILQKFVKFEDDDCLMKFRKLLSVGRKATSYQFGINDINNVIVACLDKRQFGEALNWYILSQDILKLKPEVTTFSALINAFSKEMKWDELLFLISEMQYQGISLPKSAVEAILSGSALHPSSRWRHAVRVVDDLLERSVATKLEEQMTSDSSEGINFQEIISNASIANKQKFCVFPRVLGSALLTSIEAKQPTAVRALYGRITAAHLKIEATEGDALCLHAVLPVHSDETVVPLGVAAIALEDHALLSDVLRRNTANMSSSSALLFSDSHLLTLSGEEAVNAYGALLVNDVVELLQHRRAVDCGKQFGVVMMWCLRHNKTALVVQLWNVFIQELIASLQASEAQQKSDAVVAALSHVLASCCSCVVPATTDLVQYQHNKKIANFLNGALFNMNSNTSSKTAPVFVNVTAADVSQLTDSAGGVDALLDGILSVDMKVDYAVANAMLGTFTHLQDNKAAFELLSRCLRHDIAVDVKVMNDLFDLLVADGDHKLVLDLCEFSIKQMDDAYRAERVAKLTAKTAAQLPRLRATKDDKNKTDAKSVLVADERTVLMEPNDRGFSPYVFTVAMKSLLALGDVDSIVRLLGQEIPFKGFSASNHNYEMAVRALYSHGRYEEAVRMFQQGVVAKNEYLKMHKDFTRLSPDMQAHLRRDALRDPSKTPLHRINFTNYSIAADSLHNNEDLLLCTLECAARARLAEEALTIFSERENLSVRGLAPMQLHKRCDLVDQVVVSLSSEAHIGILGDFLRSTSTLTDGFVPPVHTIQLAVAAAVAVRNETAVIAVLDFAEQFSFLVRSDLTKERLMELVHSDVRVEQGELEAVLSFVDSCECFHGMA
jgi:hypothetical protein